MVGKNHVSRGGLEDYISIFCDLNTVLGVVLSVFVVMKILGLQ